MSDTILLCSGLRIDRKNSFVRQLTLLGATFQKRGFRVVLAGQAGSLDQAADDQAVERRPVDSFSVEATDALLKDLRPVAAILLGYPDQFPFIHDRGFVRSGRWKAFLWAQISKAYRRARIGHARLVPLTQMTLINLVSGGMSIGSGEIETIIPHGVDRTVFRPERAIMQSKKEPVPGRRFTVGTVAANTTRKRFDRLVEGFRLFHETVPAARLLVKTDQARAAFGFDLEKLRVRFGLGDALEVVEKEISDRELSLFYSQLDLYVVTSEWEGFCIPAAEAMACGVPVASPPIQGPAEIVPYTDLLIPDADIVVESGTVLRMMQPDSLAGVMRRANDDPDLLRELSHVGEAHVATCFDIERVVDAWERLLTD